jgi:hypothetical protein
MYVPFHLSKNLYQESFSILYLFFTLSLRGKQRWQPRSARRYMRVGGEFCQVSIFAKLICQTVGVQFFLFCQNYMDAKLVCQTVGVALDAGGSGDGRICWVPVCCAVSFGHRRFIKGSCCTTPTDEHLRTRFARLLKKEMDKYACCAMGILTHLFL